MGLRPDEERAALERNVRLYPAYAGVSAAHFWLPVFFLYFARRLPLGDVLRLEAIYYAGVVLLEVPSGYFSDSVGRRATLLISALALVASYAVFFFADGFAMLAAGQLALATGLAFRSGTDVSFHFDSLACLEREDEFGAREARVGRNVFLVGALGALLGGASAAFGLRWAYALSFLGALVQTVFALVFREPPRRVRDEPLARGIGTQMRACVGYLRDRRLLWLFAFAVFMTIVNHVPYEFALPYLERLGGSLGLPGRGTPLVTGLYTAAAMAVGGFFAARSIRIRDRLGLWWTLLTAAALQTLVIGAMAAVVHLAIVPLILLRTAPRGLMTAPLNAAVAPALARRHRATFLSLQSLAGRLAFSGTLLLLGAAADGAGRELAAPLRGAAALAAAGFLALLVTRPRNPDSRA